MSLQKKRVSEIDLMMYRSGWTPEDAPNKVRLKPKRRHEIFDRVNRFPKKSRRLAAYLRQMADRLDQAQGRQRDA